MKEYREAMKGIMKKLQAAFLCFAAGLVPGSADAASDREKQIMLPEIPDSHPRLFVNSGTGFRPLLEARKSAAGKALAARVIHDAQVLLKEKPAERIMEGRRLLTVSRNVLYRVNTLAAAFRLTGEKAFAERAALEMCAAADFTDWNPAHFLDVAEMTLALAVGYDWLYETLDEARRVKIRDAILEKGLRPSFRGRQWWVTGKNNWNQVCHAGMVAGALAVADSEPALARKAIERAIRNLPRSMKASFSPNGAYPEGPMYWGYGTEFTVALLALLEGAFGQDFGLAEIPGFSVTGDFVIAATAPSGQLFNYADCVKTLGPSFAMHYLTFRFGRPDWFSRHEREVLAREAKERPRNLRAGRNRMLPLSLLYLRDWPETDPGAGKTFYSSGNTAAVPVAMYRTGWKKTDAYLGVKGGSPSGPHGHMDGGSFIYEADDVRWASDLGMENYHGIEARGIELWNNSRNSERWSVFRIGPDSHNILRINGNPQLTDGKAKFRRCTPESCTLDLTGLYRNDAEKVARTLELRPDGSLRITDTLNGLKPGARIRWQLCTETAALSSGASLHLQSGGKKLVIRNDCGADWTVTPAEQWMHDFDSPNGTAKIVFFEMPAPGSGRLKMTVEFLPGSIRNRK